MPVSNSVTLSEMYYIETCLSHFGKHSFNNINSYVVRAVDIEYLLGTSEICFPLLSKSDDIWTLEL